MPITIAAVAKSDIDTVWTSWNSPKDIMLWNAASEDWHTTHAEVDLRTGGAFLSRMEAKDGSAGFDFVGTYDVVIDKTLLEYSMDDGRRVSVKFEPTEDGVRITETFDPDDVYPEDLQRQGWQAILDNFVAHVESKG